MTPMALYQECWERCAHLQALHAHLEKHLTSALRPDELLRAEWVARVGALDLFVHEAIAQGMCEIYQGQRPATEAYNKFQVSLGKLAVIGASRQSRESVAAFDLEIREYLSRISYQRPDTIANGFRLISNVELWKEIALRRRGPPNLVGDEAKVIKTNLSLIVDRRNKIAHEADYAPGTPRTPWPISRRDVDDVKALVSEIVPAMNSILGN